MQRITTTIKNRVYESVIITEGGTVQTMTGWEKIAGIFASEEDALSEDADNLAIATVSWDDLDEEAQAVAAANSEAKQ